MKTWWIFGRRTPSGTFPEGRSVCAPASAKAAQTAPPRRLLLSRLEPRILLSATPATPPDEVAALAAAMVAAPMEVGAVETPAVTASTAGSTVSAMMAAGAGYPASVTSSDSDDPSGESARSTADAAEADVRRELVILDPNVDDFEMLLDRIAASGDAERRIDVVLLDGERDGVEQITEILSQYRGLDAVHLISHGTDGALRLGDAWLSQETLAAYAGMLGAWEASLSPDADLLLYGCDLASTARGRLLAESIAVLTGADVAASIDATGHASLGGDWELEYAAGAVESRVAAPLGLQSEWRSILATSTFQEGVAGYSGTQDTEIRSDMPSTSHESQTVITIDLDDGGGNTQALIRFDGLFGTGAGQIPVGATITSASLSFSVENVSNPGAQFTLHRMLVNWSETATWNSLSNGVQADDVEAMSAADSTLADPSQSGIQEFTGLAGALQSWSDGSANYGWALLTDSDNGWDFDSSEHATTALRPQLSVTWTTSPGSAMLFSTEGDSSSSGLPGLPSFDDAEVLHLADPNMALEPGTTNGTFSSMVDFDDLADDGNADIDAIHYVNCDITVGSGANTFGLIAGDLLLSTDATESFTSVNTLTATKDEIFVFRPATAGDYTSGSFFLLLDNFGAIHGGSDTWAISLVERNTRVGDTTLQAGTFLFSRQGASAHQDVRVFTPTGVGAGTTAGSTAVLIEGNDLGFSSKIFGMELIETATTIGGQTIPGGAILLSLDANEAAVGSNGLSVTPHDAWYLTVSQTTLVSGTSVATATLLYQGADVGMDSNTENIDGLAMIVQSPPVLTTSGATVDYTENDPATILDAAASVTDADSSNFAGGTLTVSFSAGGTADDRLAIRNQGTAGGQIGVSGANVTYGGTTIGTFAGGTDGSTPLVVTFNSSATPAAVTALLRNLTFENISDNPSVVTRTVSLVVTDGDGGSSNGAAVTVTVTATGPSQSTPGAQTVNEDGTLTFSSGGGNAITVAYGSTDPTIPLQVELTATNGTLTLSGTTGLSFASGSNGSSSMTVWGIASDINTALDGAFYTPTGNFNGAATVTVATSIASDLVGFYQFASVGTIGVDSSVGTQQNGTALGNATVVTDGTRGNVLSLDGNGDAIQIGSLFGSPQNVTIGGWVNLSALATGRSEFISLNDRVHIALDDFNGVKGSVQVGASSWTDLHSNQDIAGTGWRHVMYVFDDVNNIHRLYIDGAQVASAANANSIYYTGSASQTFIGRHPTATPANDLEGMVDDVRIYTRALTSDEIAALANDDHSVSGTVPITVTAVNDAPVVATSGGSIQYNENDTPLAIDTGLTLSDVDSANLTGATVRISGNYASGEDVLSFTNQLGITGSWSAATGTLTLSGTASVANYQTALRAVAYHNTSEDPSIAIRTIEFIANDGTDPSAAATRDVQIVSWNDAPATSDVSASGAEDATSIAVALSGSDADGTVDRFRLTSLPANGTLYVDAGLTTAAATGVDYAASSQALTLYFVPTADWNGATTFQYVARDAQGMLDGTPATATINVSAVNDPPQITSNGGGPTAAVSVAENTTAVTTVASSDIDGGLPGYSITGGADAGRFTIHPTTGVLTFLVAPNFESPTDSNADNVYVVTVQVSDGAGGTDTQTISVTVTPVSDEAPVITSNGGGATASVSVAENTTAVTNVTATDADLPAQTLTYSIAGGADAALFSIDSGTGVLKFVTAPDYELPTDSGGNNVYDVVVQASDGTLTDTQTISVTVTPVNDNAPTITSNGGGATASINVAENATAVTTVVATDADLPAQTITYAITGGADAGFFSIDANTGALTFSTARDYESPADGNGDNVYVVIVQASDGTLTDTQTISVTVTPVNDNAPTITSNGGGATASINVAENTTTVTTVAATDADLPAQTLTYSIGGGADAGHFTIDANTGVLTFTTARDFESPADADGNNVYVVVVRASDGTLTDTQTISVTVTPTNDAAPVITSNGGGATGSVNVPENTTAVTTVAATDSDLPAQTLTYSIAGGADAAFFTIDANTGVLTFAAAPDFDSPADADLDNVYDVIVQASDGTLTDTQALAVTVTSVNEPPVLGASAPDVTFVEGGAPQVIEAFGTVADVDSPDFNGGVLTVSITANGSADDRLQPGHFGTGPGQAGVSGSDVTYEGVVVGSFSGGSGAADPLLIVFNANATQAAFQQIFASIQFSNVSDTPSTLVRQVTFTLTDGDGGTSNSVVESVFVAATNDAPTITSDGGGPAAGINVTEGTTAVTTVTSTDVDGGVAAYSLSGADAALFTIDANTGALAFATAPDFESPADADGDNVYVVTVQVSDGAGGLDTQTISVTVTPSNDNAPTITSNGGGAIASVNVAENTTAVTTVTATDPDVPTQTLTYSIGAGADAALFTIDANTGALVFNAAPDFESPADADGDNVYVVVVQTSDGLGLTDTQTINVTVTPANDSAPVIVSNGGGANASVNVAENNTAVTTVAATDADLPAQTLTYAIIGGTDAGRFNIDANTGVLTFAAAPDFESPADADGDNVYVVSVQASDGNGGTDSQTINVTVTPSNDNAPTITSNGGGAIASVNVAENTTAVTTVTATDPDVPTQALTYSIGGGADAALFTIDANMGTLTFVAAPDFESPADADGDNVYVVIVQVSDGLGLTDTQTIGVTVTPVNDNVPAIASNGGGATAAINVAENVATVTTVTATDADLPAQTLTFSITGGADAALFTIDANTGALAFAAAPDFETPADADGDNVYEVTVQVSDGAGSVDSQAISVTVTAVNDNDPVITSNGGGATAGVNVVENTTAVTTVTATDADLPAQTLTYAISGGADAAFFSIDANTGVMTFVAAPNFETPADADGDNVYVVTVQASDGQGRIGTQTIEVTVDAENESPALTVPGPQATNEDAPLIFSTAAGNAIVVADADAGAASIEVTLAAADGTLTLATTAGLTFSIGDGADDATLRFTGTLADINAALDGLALLPTLNFNGPTSLAIDVSDLGNSGAGGALTDSAVVSLTVAAVNDATVVTLSSGGAVYIENSSPAIVDPGLTLTDVDSATLAGALVQISGNYEPGVDVLQFVDQSGITGVWDAATGTLTLSGAATVADYQAALRSVTFLAASETPSALPRSVSFAVDDGLGLGTAVSTSMDVVPTAEEIIAPPPPPTDGPSFEQDTGTEFESPPHHIAVPVLTPASLTPRRSGTAVESWIGALGRTNEAGEAPGVAVLAIPASLVRNSLDHGLLDELVELSPGEEEVLPTLTARVSVPSAMTGQSFEAVFVPLDEFQEQLDRIAEQGSSGMQLVTGSMAVVSVGMTIGYLVWIWKTGSLVLTAMTTLPAWMAFDPLPVLDSFDPDAGPPAEETDESLSSLVTRV